MDAKKRSSSPERRKCVKEICTRCDWNDVKKIEYSVAFSKTENSAYCKSKEGNRRENFRDLLFFGLKREQRGDYIGVSFLEVSGILKMQHKKKKGDVLYDE